MNEPKYFTHQESGEWLPWDGGRVDGRSFSKRGGRTVKINDVYVHSMMMEDGREWDCINGWRAECATVERVVAKALPVLKAEIDADVWKAAETGGFMPLPGASDGAPDSTETHEWAVTSSGSESHRKAQAYASRVWAGQSDSVPRVERLERVRKALEGQGLSMEGVVL